MFYSWPLQKSLWSEQFILYSVPAYMRGFWVEPIFIAEL